MDNKYPTRVMVKCGKKGRCLGKVNEAVSHLLFSGLQRLWHVPSILRYTTFSSSCECWIPQDSNTQKEIRPRNKLVRASFLYKLEIDKKVCISGLTGMGAVSAVTGGKNDTVHSTFLFQISASDPMIRVMSSPEQYSLM